MRHNEKIQSKTFRRDLCLAGVRNTEGRWDLFSIWWRFHPVVRYKSWTCEVHALKTLIFTIMHTNNFITPLPNTPWYQYLRTRAHNNHPNTQRHLNSLEIDSEIEASAVKYGLRGSVSCLQLIWPDFLGQLVRYCRYSQYLIKASSLYVEK